MTTIKNMAYWRTKNGVKSDGSYDGGELKSKRSPMKQKKSDDGKITYPKVSTTTVTKKATKDYKPPIGPRDKDGGFTTITNPGAAKPGPEITKTVYDSPNKQIPKEWTTVAKKS